MPLLRPNSMLVGKCKYLEGFSCTVTCIDESMKMDGHVNQTITCKNGIWNETAHCEEVCPDPFKYFNLPEDATLKDCSRQRNISCTINCAVGQSSVPFVRCEDNLEWRPSSFLCEIPCGRPDNVPYLKLVDGSICDFNRYEKCKVECTEGRKLVGDPFFFCQEDDEFSALPTCESTCPELPDHLISESGSDCGANAGSWCKVSCQIDNVIQEITSPWYQCLGNGTWDREFPTLEMCKTNQTLCSAPSSEHVLGHCEGSWCYTECKNSSKHTSGNAWVFCDQDGNLNTTEQTCDIRYDKNCNVSLLSENVIISDPGPYEILKQYKVYCKFRYELMKGHKDFVTCEPDGIWGNIPKCVLTCPKGDLANYGFQAREDMDKCLNYPGQWCPIHCLDQENMMPDSDAALYCKEDGSWEMPKGNCVPKSDLKGFEARCGKLPEDLKAVPDETNPESPERWIACAQENSAIDGPVIVKCLPDNKFSELPKCTKISGGDFQECRAPLYWANETVDSCLHGSKEVGTVCEIKNEELCPQTIKVICLSNNEWSKPQCYDEQFYPKQENFYY